MYRRISMVAILFLVFGILVSCGEAEEPTATPIPDIQGKIVSWGSYSPVGGRHIVLCKLLGPPQEGRCRLMETAAQTDQTGTFYLSGAEEGMYFVLYDSGLADFMEALDRWGGQEMNFSDPDWLAEFLGVDIRTDPIEFRVPEGISHSPHMGWLTHYCTLTLSVGDSPFIVAHDLELAQQDRELICLTVEIEPGQTKTIEVEAAYYGSP